MELARGVLIAGKYRLERPLANGGMGSVWVARHTQLETEAAIKFMDPQGAASAVARARFEREAKASATLRNRHVVHVLDYGVENDLPYLVMELLHGEDLSKRLHRERRLPLGVAARILMETAKGLRTAHEAHVVHRDLKPANIFLARDDGEEEEIVKVLDFGIAKDVSTMAVGEATRTGELMGSPHYMSPEQVRGRRDIDHRSDLWSLAVVMFRVLTGRMPFNGDNVGAVIAQILADPIPVASQIAPDLPPAVDAFLARAFARDRDQRFQSAREMADTFAAIAAAHGSFPDAVRWSAAGPASVSRASGEDPLTRQRQSSQWGAGMGGDLATPPPRPEIPTESMRIDPPTPGTASSASSGFGGTGGPVMHTAPPPPAPTSLLRWLPLIGAGVGVLIGAVAFLAVPHRTSEASATTGVPSATEAAPAPAAPAATTEVAREPEPVASVAPTPPATPSDSAAPSADVAPSASANVAASAGAAPSSKPTSKPSRSKETPPGKPPPPPPPGKKKPNWGF